MKKALSLFLTIAMVLQAGLFTVFADDTERKITEINIGSIDMVWTDGTLTKVVIKLDPNGSVTGISGSKEITITGEDIDLKNGEYNFQLKAGNGFVFENELDINYQGIVGTYGINYSFPQNGDMHTMIVTGKFYNVISESPLSGKVDLGKLLSLVISGDYAQAAVSILNKEVFIDRDSYWKPVTGDKYEYNLVLKTGEGFTFDNNLQFTYDEKKYGYTLTYDYDLSSKKGSLTIRGLAEKEQEEPENPIDSNPTDNKPSDSKPYVGKGASAKDTDKAITGMTSDDEAACLRGTSFTKLKFRSDKQTKTTVTLRWTKKSNAVGYVIYGNKCGSKAKPKKIKTVKNKNTVKISELRKGTYYKFILVAIDKKGKVVATSKMIHVATKSGKAGNYKSVKISKSVVSKAKKLNKGKKLKLKAKPVRQDKNKKVKKHSGLRYASTSTKIATVSSKGVITAKKKGTCYIYAYAQNGVYKRIKVIVR